jgi:proline iminopeptidase
LTDLFVEPLGDPDSPVALVPLHGPGLDHSYFRPWLDSLATAYRVVFFDQRLSGRSPRISSIVPTLDVLANDVVEITRHYCRRKVVVAGHSFSAWTALEVATRHRNAIHGVILIAPGLWPSVAQTLLKYLQQSAGREVTQLVLDAFENRMTTDAEFGDAWQKLLPWYLAADIADLQSRLFRHTRFSLAGHQAFLAHVVGRIDFVAALTGLSCPLLVLAGANDWLERDPHGGSSALAQLAPRSTFVAIQDSGHFPFAEQPQAFCDTMAEWFGQL